MNEEVESSGEPAPARAATDELAERIDEASRQQELSDPDAGLGHLDRAVNKIVEVAGVSVLFTIVAVIFVNAVGRYAFNNSLIWAEELVLLLVPWLAMTGVFLAVRRGTMIRIDFFYEKLPRVFRRPVGTLGELLCAAVLTFMAGMATQYLLLFGADPTPYLDVPKGLSSAALAIGGLAAAIAFLYALYRERRTRDLGR